MKGWPRGDVNIPLLRGNGSYLHGSDTYRFLVIDRYQSIVAAGVPIVPPETKKNKWFNCQRRIVLFLIVDSWC